MKLLSNFLVEYELKSELPHVYLDMDGDGPIGLVSLTKPTEHPVKRNNGRKRMIILHQT